MTFIQNFCGMIPDPSVAGVTQAEPIETPYGPGWRIKPLINSWHWCQIKIPGSHQLAAGSIARIPIRCLGARTTVRINAVTEQEPYWNSAQLTIPIDQWIVWGPTTKTDGVALTGIVSYSGMDPATYPDFALEICATPLFTTVEEAAKLDAMGDFEVFGADTLPLPPVS